jgi:hypothetical protein
MMVKLYDLLSKAMFDLTTHTLIEAFTIDFQWGTLYQQRFSFVHV